MGTSAIIGFSRRSDLEDFKGIWINYDGYPQAIVTNLALYIKFGKFSDVVKGINSGIEAKGMNYFGEYMNKKSIFEFYEDEPSPMLRDDFYQSDYSYVISKNKIKVYEDSRNYKVYDIDKLNLQQIVKEAQLFNVLFSGERSAHGGLKFFDYLDNEVWAVLK